jgi:penicillin amidase
MNQHDPNGGSGRGPRGPLGVNVARDVDDKRGFGAPMGGHPGRYSDANDFGSAAPFGARDWDQTENEEEGSGEGPTRRRRGSSEPSPYPRHHVASLGAKTRVVRDPHGVPHIHAKEERDAYAALGFCMAEDRLVQMDLVRRAATGRLAEILGRDFVRHDALVRTAGIARRAAASSTLLQGVAREVMAAFVGGVNAVCAVAPPAERAQHPIPLWTVADCLAIELHLAWSLGLDVWPAKLVLARILSTAGLERARWISPTRLDLDLANEERTSLWKRIDPRIIDLLVRGGGSGTAWAVDGGRTGGAPLLACDLDGPARLPVPLYLAHLEAPGLSVLGASIVGLPAIVAGRNARCAWGVTPLSLDDADCVTEELDGIGNFREEDGWKKLAARREIIRVRDGETVPLEVLETRNGPLLSRLVEQLDGLREDGVRPASLAIRWGVNSLSSSIAGWLAVAKSADLAQMGEAAALLDKGPVGLNVIAAESRGDVARWAVGSLPTRSIDARLPVRGSLSKVRWRASVPVSVAAYKAPDEDGTIASAGEAHLAGEEWSYPPHEFAASQARLRKLAEELAAETPSVRRFEELQRSPREAVLEELVPLFERAASSGRTPVCERRAEGPGAVLAYVAIVHHLLPEVFPESRFGALHRHARLARGALVRILSADSSPWFANAEERDASLARALSAAFQTLEQQYGSDTSRWTWDRLQTDTSVPAAGGATEVVAATATPEEVSSPFEILAAETAAPSPQPLALHPSRVPAFRMVVDLATRQMRVILAGGQSGRPENPHYADQLAAWREGQYLELELGELKEGDIVELIPG